jgi:hypothetical protein
MTYRRALEKVIHTRDWKKLMEEFAAPGFEAGFKGQASSRGSLWKALADILRFGLVRTSDTSFEGPYFVVRYPNEFVTDSAEATRWAITARNVPVRKQPVEGSPVIETLSFELVEKLRHEDRPGDRGGPIQIGPDKHGDLWYGVRTPDGKIGYVNSRFAGDINDWQATFTKLGKKWVLAHCGPLNDL